MKTPRFEELAQRYRDDARFFIVYSREAHPDARGADRLAEVAQKVKGWDGDGDGVVTRDEFRGNPFMWQALDFDADGKLVAKDFLTVEKIRDYKGFAQPSTLDERKAAARRFRDEVPGPTPILIDDMDNAVTKAYGGKPNNAVVIDRGCGMHTELDWANVPAVETALADLTGRPAPKPRPEPDWSVLEDALAAAGSKPLLVQFTSPGCPACERTKETLADPAVAKAMKRFAFEQVGIETDAVWALFEALELGATPAFVVVEPGPTVSRVGQGFHDKAAMLALLQE